MLETKRWVMELLPTPGKPITAIFRCISAGIAVASPATAQETSPGAELSLRLLIGLEKGNVQQFKKCCRAALRSILKTAKAIYLKT